ncbi:MAG: hypothetical protein ACM3SX_09000 [Deltaproteobacteria bacterium]
MTKTVAVLQMLARLLGVVQILVGLAIWFGRATSAVAFHSALGSLFVLVVWIIAIIALFALSHRTLPLITLLVGGVALWFGMAQTTLLVGSAHWSVRLAHLLVGLATLGLAESLAKAVKRHHAALAAAA